MLKRIYRIISIVIICFILIYTSNYLDSIQQELGILRTRIHLNLFKFKSPLSTKPNKPKFESNSTHLWSIPLADETYFRLSYLLPCRKITYQGGFSDEQMNSCLNASDQEFSIENTIKFQKWLFNHQHPSNCSNKKYALLKNFALSGFGSTIHQLVSPFLTGLLQDRIIVYSSPGNWLYGDCPSNNPDCFFLPITNCSVPLTIDGDQMIEITNSNDLHNQLRQQMIFKNHSFNWIRCQILFYMTRFNNRTLNFIYNTIKQNFHSSSLQFYRPYVSIYVRRSDKIKSKEMSQSYSLKQYFDLFENDIKKVNINTIYINSEDPEVFHELDQLNKINENRYRIIKIKSKTNLVFIKLLSMSRTERGRAVLDFLTDLFIEVNADLHVGTLTSNWCRLVDEIRMTLGKIIPFYTPENSYLINSK